MLALTQVTGSCCGKHFGNGDWVRVEVRLQRNLESVADTGKYGKLGNTKYGARIEEECVAAKHLMTWPSLQIRIDFDVDNRLLRPD